MDKIGSTIQKYREVAGISQERLAEAIGVTPTFISYIERGTRLPSLETFVKIANVINISTDALLADVLKTTHREQANEYLDRIENLPLKERQHILVVLEALLAGPT